MRNTVAENLKKLELTEATRFVLPMLYTSDRNDSFFITPQFRNCYIGDVNHPEYQNKILLLYAYKMTISFVQFERALELIPEYKTDYDYADEHWVMYVFDVPEDHLGDFQLFLEGRYSEFSPVLKSKILNFWGQKEGSTFHSVLYKTDEVLRHWERKEVDYTLTAAKDEYWPKPVMNKEQFMIPN
jgi:uncharacterized protein Usg